MPDPDLLIRTSGEYRISNYLLWQIAYSELYFTDKLWPDFGEEDLFQAVLDYQRRERRFGLRSVISKAAAPLQMPRPPHHAHTTRLGTSTHSHRDSSKVLERFKRFKPFQTKHLRPSARESQPRTGDTESRILRLLILSVSCTGPHPSRPHSWSGSRLSGSNFSLETLELLSLAKNFSKFRGFELPNWITLVILPQIF